MITFEINRDRLREDKSLNEIKYLELNYMK